LSTLAPKDWTIVSNEFNQESSDIIQKQALGTLNEAAKVFGATEIVSSMESPTVTMFKQSPKIPTYLFAIVAGPFKHVAMNE